MIENVLILLSYIYVQKYDYMNDNYFLCLIDCALTFFFLSILSPICVLTPFNHDVHVCVFTMMYMFVNCMYPCIHQGLKPRPHGYTIRS